MTIALFQEYYPLALWIITIHMWWRRRLILMNTTSYKPRIRNGSESLDLNHRSHCSRVSNWYVGGACDLDPELSR